MKITKVSKAFIEKVKHDEGFESLSYKCPAGVWTIGYGTTRYPNGKKVTESDNEVTRAEAEQYLLIHLSKVEIIVDNLCRDDLNQNQFDAICDFVYNAGTSYIDKKGIKRLYNIFANVNKYMTKGELTKYWSNLAITGGGKKLNGLIKRRKYEVDLYFS
jgi:lysozyme